jgi:hypothetical protein
VNRLSPTATVEKFGIVPVANERYENRKASDPKPIEKRQFLLTCVFRIRIHVHRVVIGLHTDPVRFETKRHRGSRGASLATVSRFFGGGTKILDFLFVLESTIVPSGTTTT